MLKQIRLPVLKRPFGVSIIMPGGLKGYSGGKRSRPVPHTHQHRTACRQLTRA